MARGKLWGYVASGARVLGALGGGIGGALGGTLGGTGGAGGGRAGEPDDGAAAVEGLGLVRPGAVAGPRALSRPELERLRWTGRQAGCGPLSRHVQVADVLRRVVRGGGRAANVTVRVAPGLPVVAGDARRLEAAVAGLVDHAIRRSPLGARVSVRAEAAGGPGSGAAAWDRGRVEVRISDRGWYEPPEAREWLLARVRPGGPVGPALHSLVLAAGGWIAVEPTPGGGLTVVLLLAVAQE
ncbi:sensor histidine kinase [Streptomyces sp. Y1]|uniref:Sensor histidine kinase n=1 Tax=Streptomyces sp. Y1 TaxID=3238634 RepID=A0AB39TD63_9ACTN